MKHVRILQENEDHLARQQPKNLARRATGRFYTHEIIGKHLIAAILAVFRPSTGSLIRVVDPFCGDGRLIQWLVDEIASREDLRRCAWKVDLWEYDEEALQKAKRNVTSLAQKHGLQMDVDATRGDTFMIAKQHFGHFHLTITNPPWEILKPDSRELSQLKRGDAAKYITSLRSYSAMLAQLYPLSKPHGGFLGWGTNLARYGTEVALRLTHSHGICGIVSPASLLGDHVSVRLRQWIFENFTIHDLAFFPAEAKLFDQVDQPAITIVASPEASKKLSPTVTIYNRKGERQTQMGLTLDKDELATRGFVVPVHFGLDPMQLFSKWKHLPVFRDLEGKGLKDLWAGRELDETRYRTFVGDEGDYLFVKGYMVQRFNIAEMPVKCVKHGGPPIPNSANYYRVAWRDVSRPSQKRRMQAMVIPAGWVTGNSLNVAYFGDNNIERTKALLAIMNSLVFEFQVRSYLSTAHVSLSTVRKAHIPELANSKLVSKLSELADRCLANDDSAYIELEVTVAQLYDLSREEFKLLLSCFDKLEEHEVDKLLSDKLWQSVRDGLGTLGGISPALVRTMNIKIPNHYSAPLSELDLMMVRSVPPGGNWKNIPESIPSKRLEQIRKSYLEGGGSRSTYYGRLHPDLPSYTITTYFNRPGNGCNIHYDYEGDQHRLISQREAARLQSFPDSFVFHGNRAAVNEQIGNAVPPLLSYQIARSFPYHGQFVDLFCGAGGLSLGFKWAGWEPLVASDIREDFLKTYSANIHGETILGDIRDQRVFDTIIHQIRQVRRGAENLPLLVLGGPPCQGFSTAGLRRSVKDERNWLFCQFKDLVMQIKPTGFIFENVPGLLNMEGGAVFEIIRNQLQAACKSLQVWRLRCEEYGIPQRRTRIFIAGNSDPNFVLNPPGAVTKLGTQAKLFDNVPRAITVCEVLSDLPRLKPGEDGSIKDYSSEPLHPYQAFARSFMSAEEYLTAISKSG